MARALAARPEIIFGDEPTGNLDSRAGAEVLGFLRRSVDELGQTIVMVTHDPVAASYADRVAVPRRRPDRRRDVQADRRRRPGPHEGLRRPGADVMTVLKTSMRNFFAHKGRMALSAMAVLLSVAFVCGTLVFTDTMNTTFDKLFAATASDVTVSPKGAADSGDDDRRQRQAAESLPASAARARSAKADGVKSAEGAVVSMSRDRRRRRQRQHGLHQRRPDHRRQLEQQRRPRRWRSPPATPRAAPTEVMVDADTADKHGLKLGDELRDHRRHRRLHREDLRHRRLQGHQPRRRRSSTSTPPPPSANCSARPACSPTSTSPPPPASATRS